MTRTTKAPLALLLVAVLAIAAALATVATSPAEAAARKPDPVSVSVGDARIAGSKASVRLSWTKAKGAKGYQVLWSSKRSMKKARSATVRKRSYTVRGLKVGQSWCFQVRAVAGKKKGKRSAPICRKVAKPGQSKSPWVTAQRVVGTGSAARAELTLTWRATAGARAYELDYAVTREPVEKYPLWLNKARRTLTTSTNRGVLPHLLPGTIYCFQVRAITAGGTSDRSPTHCKVTMPVNRSAPARGSIPLDVATWNICATVCNAAHPFAKRVAAIGQRIARMDVDVVMLQETYRSETAVARAAGFTVGCLAASDHAEAVLVRTTRYTVVDQGENMGDPGACWVRLKDRTTQKDVIVVSLHLKPGTGATVEAKRKAQIQKVLAWVPRPAGVPVVMGGDYNSSRSRDNDSPRPPLESAGFRDSYDIAAAYLSPTTANSMNGWNTVPGESTRWGAHIDRVFSSSGSYASSWQVVEPRGADGRYDQLLSDHSPVKVTLAVPVG